MSMNFGREQALLRQRLTAKGSAERAAVREARYGSAVKFLGAADDEIVAAATELADNFPQMGRAQMTAFVRTLWQSKIHELRAVGVEILALRAQLLEPPDLPFLEGLLIDASVDTLSMRLAGDVLGPLVSKNKKLWKDLRRLAGRADSRLRRAAVFAAKAPLLADGTVFERFEKMVTPLLAQADEALQQAIDEVLQAAADQDATAVSSFAQQHGRKVKLPKPKATPAAPAVAAKTKRTESQSAESQSAAKPPTTKAPATKTAKKAKAAKAPAMKAAASKTPGKRAAKQAAGKKQPNKNC